MTTLAVFLPVIFIQEEAGQLFRDIALAISAAVGLSLLVSVIVIPTAAAGILKQRSARSTAANGVVTNGAASNGVPHPPKDQGKGILRSIDTLGAGFVASVNRFLGWLQESTLRRIAAAGLLVGLSILGSLALLPKVEYLPSGNRNLVIGIIQPPPGYNIDQMVEMGEQIQTALQPYWDVDPGTPEAKALDYPAIGDFFYVARGRSIFMGIRSTEPLRAGELVPLMQSISKDIPGIFVIAKQSSLFEQGLTAGRTVEIEIVGPELETLVGLGGQVLGKVKQLIPEAQARPIPSLDLSSPEVHVLPKWEQAADLGIDAAELGYTVDALVDGAYASDYYRGGDKIDLTIIGQERFANRTQDLESLVLAAPDGQLVPLNAVAQVKLSSGPEQVNHRERQRAVTIEVTPPPAMALEEAMNLISSEIVQPLVMSEDLGSAYRINLSGTADKLSETWRSLWFNLVLALLITYLLMAALFESWLYPLVIILSVPLGAIGGFAGLKLLNLFVLQSLDVLTMLGFVILIGTVVNNPILIVHQSLNLIRSGVSRNEAIRESLRSRIRPIFMTTTTTVLGLLPLVLFPGAGSELYRGLGSVVLGGLIASTLFTLILVPVLFNLALDARDRVVESFRSFRKPSAEPELEASPGLSTPEPLSVS